MFYNQEGSCSVKATQNLNWVCMCVYSWVHSTKELLTIRNLNCACWIFQKR